MTNQEAAKRLEALHSHAMPWWDGTVVSVVFRDDVLAVAAALRGLPQQQEAG